MDRKISKLRDILIRHKRVLVAFSGGVDSSVAAALLKKQGLNVVGVFMRCVNLDGCAVKDAEDARRVAEHLDIPFYVFDLEDEYRRRVVDYMIGGYRKGTTPNPDVMCNKEIKFGLFLKKACALGADGIATGHYARVRTVQGRPALFAAKDANKDQSYFLWTLTPEILAHTLFPVGGLKKSEVRKLAAKFKLPNAERPDSQGVCFLGSVSVEEFLKKELGDDNPALLYTIGQRIEGGYVVGKDVEKKEIKIAKTRAGGAREVRFTDANWFSEPAQATEAQYRYRGSRMRGRIEGDIFISAHPLPDIPAPGQSLVFYRDGELIGGGIITV